MEFNGADYVGRGTVVENGSLFIDDFGGSTLDDNRWDVESIGSGMAYSVTGSELVITTGTTSGAELIFRCPKPIRTANFLLDFQARLSQRIANQEFRVRLSNKDQTSYVEWMFDGTTATTHKMQSSEGGNAWTANATSAPTLLTNPPAYSFGIDMQNGQCMWVYDLLHSYNQAGYVYQSRDAKLPEPGEELYLEIRAKNTGAAGSTTTFAIDLIKLQTIFPVNINLAGSNGNAGASRALPVNIVTGTVYTYPISGAASGGGTSARIAAAASTNTTSVKASAARLHSFWLANNTAAAKFFKLYNKAAAPVLASDTPIATLIIPANNWISGDFGSLGVQLSAGLAYAITGAIGDTDTTATAANDVHGVITYT